METVLFIPYFIESHILPTLGMTNILKTKYRVVYALPAKFKWFADLHQLEYINLESVPVGYGFETMLANQKKGWSKYRSILKDRKRSRIAKHRGKKLLEVTTATAPSIIILDLLSTTDFILLYDYLEQNNTAVAIHNPMLSAYFHWSVPHLGSSLPATPRFPVAAQNLLIKCLFYFFDFKENLLYFGNGNKRLIKKEFRKRNIPSPYKLDGSCHFANLFKNIPEIISAPEELEFYQGRSLPTQHYIGYLPASRTDESETSPEDARLSALLELWKKEKKYKIVVCAFGTMRGQANPVVRNFLKKLFGLQLGKQDIKLVCSFNDGTDFFNPEELPGHIILLKRIPQTRVLTYADLFITHAGLGSVKESIHAGVPMLAYPYTKSWDSYGNAVKIHYHQLGLKGDIQKDPAAEIEKKIFATLSGKQFRENVLQFKGRTEQKYTKDYFMSVFENLVGKRYNQGQGNR